MSGDCPFDGLPRHVQDDLVCRETMEGEGRPKGSSLAPWQAERYLRVLTDEQLNIYLNALRDYPFLDSPPLVPEGRRDP